MSTYKIVRFYQSDDYDTEVIETGLSLEEAQAHCQDPETSSSTATNDVAKARTERCGEWFDGYEKERESANAYDSRRREVGI